VRKIRSNLSPIYSSDYPTLRHLDSARCSALLGTGQSLPAKAGQLKYEPFTISTKIQKRKQMPPVQCLSYLCSYFQKHLPGCWQSGSNRCFVFSMIYRLIRCIFHNQVKKKNDYRPFMAHIWCPINGSFFPYCIYRI